MTSVSSVVNKTHTDFQSEYAKYLTGDNKTLFDNSDVVTDAKNDSSKVDKIKDSVNNAKATDKSKKAAKKLLKKFGVGKKIADHTILETKPANADKLDSNSFKVKIKTGGKEQWMKITCDEDGNYKMTGKINGKDVSYLYDKNDKLRRKKVKDGNKTTVSEYDANGKINKKVVKEGDTTKTSYYDDNGKLTQKKVNDGSTTKTTNYEYDAKGNKVGTRTVKTYNDDTSTPKKKIITSTIFTENGKISTIDNEITGERTNKTYKKNSDGSYSVQSSTREDKNGNTVETREYLKTFTVDGKKIRVVKVTDKDGKVYFHRQVLNKNGKIETTYKYENQSDAESEKLKDNYTKKFEYTYDKNGNRKTQTITDMATGKKKTNTWKAGKKTEGQWQ